MDVAAEAPLVPGLEIRELVVRGKRRVRLAVALHLGDFVERLPAHPALRVVAVERLLRGQRHVVEHQAAGEVAVVRDGEHAGARLPLRLAHPFPQVLGILAVVLRERNHLIGLGLAVPEDHVAVQVVAGRTRGPLVADEGGELARFVVFFGRGSLPRPHRPRDGLAALQGVLPDEHPLTPGVVGEPTLPALDQIVHRASELRLQEVGVRLGDHRRQTEILRMIGDDQEVQRPKQARADAGAGGDLLAAGESIGLLRPQPATHHSGIRRVGRVEVRVAEIHPVGVTAVEIRRVFGLAELDMLGIDCCVLRKHGGAECGHAEHESWTKRPLNTQAEVLLLAGDPHHVSSSPGFRRSVHPTAGLNTPPSRAGSQPLSWPSSPPMTGAGSMPRTPAGSLCPDLALTIGLPRGRVIGRLQGRTRRPASIRAAVPTRWHASALSALVRRFVPARIGPVRGADVWRRTCSVGRLV